MEYVTPTTFWSATTIVASAMGAVFFMVSFFLLNRARRAHVSAFILWVKLGFPSIIFFASGPFPVGPMIFFIGSLCNGEMGSEKIQRECSRRALFSSSGLPMMGGFLAFDVMYITSLFLQRT